MSYTMVVEWTCHACGGQAQSTSLVPPAGWSGPNKWAGEAGPHYHTECWRIYEAACKRVLWVLQQADMFSPGAAFGVMPAGLQ